MKKILFIIKTWIIKIKNFKEAFTIVELMIVLSIIGIMLTIITQKHIFVYNRAKDAALMINLHTLRNAVYRASLENNGIFPQSLDELYPKFLNKKPELYWVGSNGKGIIKYDPFDGTIKLFDIDGRNPSLTLDSKGIPYGNY